MRDAAQAHHITAFKSLAVSHWSILLYVDTKQITWTWRWCRMQCERIALLRSRALQWVKYFIIHRYKANHLNQYDGPDLSKDVDRCPSGLPTHNRCLPKQYRDEPHCCWSLYPPPKTTELEVHEVPDDLGPGGPNFEMAIEPSASPCSLICTPALLRITLRPSWIQPPGKGFAVAPHSLARYNTHSTHFSNVLHPCWCYFCRHRRTILFLCQNQSNQVWWSCPQYLCNVWDFYYLSDILGWSKDLSGESAFIPHLKIKGSVHMLCFSSLPYSTVMNRLCSDSIHLNI